MSKRLKRVLFFTVCFYFSNPEVLASERKTVPPDVDGVLEDGKECVPTYRKTLCLVQSKPPLPGISCPSDFCTDETTSLLADKALNENLLERYPGSFVGSCPGFVRPNPPKDAKRVCGPKL